MEYLSNSNNVNLGSKAHYCQSDIGNRFHNHQHSQESMKTQELKSMKKTSDAVIVSETVSSGADISLLSKFSDEQPHHYTSKKSPLANQNTNMPPTCDSCDTCKHYASNLSKLQKRRGRPHSRRLKATPESRFNTNSEQTLKEKAVKEVQKANTFEDFSVTANSRVVDADVHEQKEILVDMIEAKLENIQLSDNLADSASEVQEEPSEDCEAAFDLNPIFGNDFVPSTKYSGRKRRRKVKKKERIEQRFEETDESEATFNPTYEITTNELSFEDSNTLDYVDVNFQPFVSEEEFISPYDRLAASLFNDESDEPDDDEADEPNDDETEDNYEESESDQANYDDGFEVVNDEVDEDFAQSNFDISNTAAILDNTEKQRLKDHIHPSGSNVPKYQEYPVSEIGRANGEGERIFLVEYERETRKVKLTRWEHLKKNFKYQYERISNGIGFDLRNSIKREQLVTSYSLLKVKELASESEGVVNVVAEELDVKSEPKKLIGMEGQAIDESGEPDIAESDTESFFSANSYFAENDTELLLKLDTESTMKMEKIVDVVKTDIEHFLGGSSKSKEAMDSDSPGSTPTVLFGTGSFCGMSDTGAKSKVSQSRMKTFDKQGNDDDTDDDNDGSNFPVPSTSKHSEPCICDICLGLHEFEATDDSKIHILDEEESYNMKFYVDFQVKRLCNKHYIRYILDYKLSKFCCNPLNKSKHKSSHRLKYVDLAFCQRMDR